MIVLLLNCCCGCRYIVCNLSLEDATEKGIQLIPLAALHAYTKSSFYCHCGRGLAGCRLCFPAKTVFSLQVVEIFAKQNPPSDVGAVAHSIWAADAPGNMSR